MDSFEMHLMDSGLVSSLMGADVRERFMKGVRDRECKELSRSVVACSLVKNGHQLYFHKNGSNDMDFVMSIHGNIMGMRLTERGSEEDPDGTDRLRCMMGPPWDEDTDDARNLPLFAPCFMKMTYKEDSLPVRDDGELMAAFDAVLGKGDPERI